MNTNNNEYIHGIRCDVTNCHFNYENQKCSAHEIKVGPQYANTTSDTVCATFKPQGMVM